MVSKSAYSHVLKKEPRGHGHVEKSFHHAIGIGSLGAKKKDFVMVHYAMPSKFERLRNNTLQHR